MKIKLCIHNHTESSKYSTNSKEHFSKAFDQGIIDKVAITDHDYIRSAQEFQKYFGEKRIIVGEEISTTDGDLIGLFLKKFVPTGVSAERAIQHIHNQGGLVLASHPYDPKKGIGEELLNKLKDEIDIVEIFNSWRFRSIKKPLMSKKVNEMAEKWVKENNKPGVASSDSHYDTNIGRSYTVVEDFDSPEELIFNLQQDGVEHVKRNAVINFKSFQTYFKGKFNRR